MIDGPALAALLADHLSRQRWFASGDRLDEVAVRSSIPLRREWPALVQVVVDATLAGGAAPARFQLLVGLRPHGDGEWFLDGRGEALIGPVGTDLGPALAYDATVDTELAIALLHHLAPEEEVERSRLVATEQSNTSIVFDERLILKLFRRLADGPNPGAEVPAGLARVGFTNVARPVADWRVDDVDLATVSEFLVGGADGFSLALTSLRDLYDRGGDPGEAGGDFAPDARRLGIITAKMHLALAEAFGTTRGDSGAWADDMEAHLARVGLGGVEEASVRAVYDALRTVRQPGPALRIHGDYHLGQVLRTDTGWYVLDFEGEPDRPLEERRRPSSPLRDVAGMVRSFHYAASVATREWREEADATIAELAAAWEQRNAFAFVEGYLAADGVEAVLPADEADRELVRRAYELDKAVYEVGYESAHRPDWADIPRAAVARLLIR